ncbi:ACP S-malonyltransferase [Saccharibacillus sp. JS10]|uniref:ACP S-malonyltransferase n=1 Tax=Saccharibacillus sp. JS10 TaxID=2950552 RepID=UPI00210D3001|nr:ACP S-malonyltransferase [Saccharibacillus sp. JS10]MCQ4087151.1 ACP S-malonyltransferase [Saccharibacillus sp. JS10]
MSKIAFVFPGQGAQSVGMARDVYEASADAKALFDTADQVLGMDLTNLIFEGPAEELKQTANTQPALLTASVALLQAVNKQGIKADYVAGHSLGEYSALAAAGVLSFEDAVSIVRLRGQFMEAAVPSGQGAMAAVLGAERGKLTELCAEISAEGTVVEPANMNCPGQIVVSGSAEGVAALSARVKDIGAKRAIALEVSGPFHSSMMKEAAEKLGEHLSSLTFNDSEIPVVANVTARPVSGAENVKESLIRQVYSPVLWEDSVQWLIGEGVDTFIEIGPGNVLAGLIKKIDKSVRIFSVNSLESAEALTSELNE